MINRKLFVVGRVLLWAALITWSVYGLWSGGHRTIELLSLRNSGKHVNAQIIGCEPMPAGQRLGYVHYSFNEGSISISSRLEVPVSAYPNFQIGQSVPVTYLPQNPHTLRIGAVDSGTVMRSIVVGVVFLLIGLIAFGLPLIGISAFLNTSRPASNSV